MRYQVIVCNLPSSAIFDTETEAKDWIEKHKGIYSITGYRKIERDYYDPAIYIDVD